MSLTAETRKKIHDKFTIPPVFLTLQIIDDHQKWNISHQLFSHTKDSSFLLLFKTLHPGIIYTTLYTNVYFQERPEVQIILPQVFAFSSYPQYHFIALVIPVSELKKKLTLADSRFPGLQLDFIFGLLPLHWFFSLSTACAPLLSRASPSAAKLYAFSPGLGMEIKIVLL